MEPEPITPISDDEAELFRFLRFGELPERIPPGEMVESVETDPVHEDPRPLIDPESPYYGV